MTGQLPVEDRPAPPVADRWRRRIVEPGVVELRLGRSSDDFVARLVLRLVGDERQVGHDRQLVSRASVRPVPAGGR